MKTLLILGAGTGGTMMANRMHTVLDPREWRIVIVDHDETHYYQPGLLFIPFGTYSPGDIQKPKRKFLPQGVEVVFGEIELIEPEQNRVRVAGAEPIHYDYLVVATGSDIRPEEISGMKDGAWHQNIFDFYTLPGATALGEFLKTWRGGRMVLSVAEMPIKCPVAPLEFLFLADSFFKEKGMRDKVDITFATPLPGAFTKPRASSLLGHMLTDRGITVESEYAIMEVDNSSQVIRSYDEREVGYDLLVTVPTNMGASVIGASGLGDELNFVPTNKHTLQSEKWENIWIIGDAGNVPASKAGSVAHFMLDVVAENILRHMEGQEPLPNFDGHANCFIETGGHKGVMIDFNYEVEPLPGMYPLPGVGPFPLLRESAVNHWGKMMFKWIYWNILLKGREIPVPSQMSMAGKWN